MLTKSVVAKAKPKEKLYRITDGLKNGLSLEISAISLSGVADWRLSKAIAGSWQLP